MKSMKASTAFSQYTIQKKQLQGASPSGNCTTGKRRGLWAFRGRLRSRTRQAAIVPSVFLTFEQRFNIRVLIDNLRAILKQSTGIRGRTVCAVQLVSENAQICCQ